MSEVKHTIELLEQRKRPPGSAYTIRHCDEKGCQARATHIADGTRYLCPAHLPSVNVAAENRDSA